MVEYQRLATGLVFDRGYVEFHIRGFSCDVTDIIHQFLAYDTEHVYATGDKHNRTIVKSHHIRGTGLDPPDLATTPFPSRVQGIVYRMYLPRQLAEMEERLWNTYRERGFEQENERLQRRESF